jgi:CheY-like chemotaxis protein
MKPNIKTKYNTAVLIDDNNIDNFINEQMLTITSFSKQRFIATNGQLALNLIHNLTSSRETGEQIYPDILFVDINMPVMDGMQFIREFRKIDDDHLQRCKIVVLTSSIHEDDRERVRQIDPAIAFIHKPLTVALLKNL